VQPATAPAQVMPADVRAQTVFAFKSPRSHAQ